MRLIDADALEGRILMDAPGFMDGGSEITKAFILAMIKTRSVTPTVDAVPVVRCKDCIHSTIHCIESILGEPLYDCHNPRWNYDDIPTMKWDWYCADGERK